MYFHGALRFSMHSAPHSLDFGVQMLILPLQAVTGH